VASHDPKEPIRMVSAYTSLLRERYKDVLPAEAKEYMGFILDGTSRMQHLVRDLLEYSRIGTSNDKFGKVDCNTVMQCVKQNLKELIIQNRVVIEMDDLPQVKGIETQLVQLFQNLVENAIKFKGTESPVIQISVADELINWHFCIRDNGIGIAPEYFNKIFSIFQRLHTRNEYEGTGIGLSVCKKIVELHGGRLWVESEPDVGSNFQFTLPKIL
jgi:light-regulated signal transduction histidine kinase (bacteriophytochrome)